MSDPADIQRMIGDLIRIGVVESVSPATGTCRLRVGDIVTGDVPWGSGRAGRTSTWSPPSVGEQRLLFCPEADTEGGVLGQAIYSDANPAPGDRADLELVRIGDATFSYDSAADLLELDLPAGATVRIVSTGGVTLDASAGGLKIKGDVEVDGKISATGDVKADTISLRDHVHLGVQAGAAKSGKPF